MAAALAASAAAGVTASRRIRHQDTRRGTDVVLPPRDRWLMDMSVQKQMHSALGIQWRHYRLVYDTAQVMFSEPESNVVCDFIPLEEIEQIQLLERNEDDEDAKGQQSRLQSAARKSLITDKDPFSLDDDDIDPLKVLVVHVIADGHNLGRKTIILCASMHSRDSLKASIQKLVDRAKEQKEARENPGIIPHCQRETRRVYESDAVQYMVCSIILISYITTLVETQTNPRHDGPNHEVFLKIEIGYTVFFTVDLIVHMFAVGWNGFFSEWLNVFDVFVVATSLASFFVQALPGMNVMRLFRVARVLRIMRVVRSLGPLRILVTALYNAVLPLMYSFFLLALAITVFAVIATDLFGIAHADRFGDLRRSLFSLFQTSTGDGWATDIVFDLVVHGQDDGVSRDLVELFFIVFFLLVGVVLMNILIAQLLDEFLSTVSAERKDELRRQWALRKVNQISTDRDWPLDPLIGGLLIFANDDDLGRKITEIYERMDVDESGSLSLDELNQGLMHLNLGHKVQLTHDEFWQCAQDGRLLNEEGELEPEGFRRMIVSQLRLFISRQIIQVMGRLELEQRGHEPQPDQTILLALKTVMNHVHDVHAAVDRVSHKIDPRGSKDLANSQRSRMEIIVALQKLAMRKAWRRWCVSIWGDQQWREREMDDREYMTTRLDRVEETLSGVQASVVRIESLLMHALSQLEPTALGADTALTSNAHGAHAVNPPMQAPNALRAIGAGGQHLPPLPHQHFVSPAAGASLAQTRTGPGRSVHLKYLRVDDRLLERSGLVRTVQVMRTLKSPLSPTSLRESSSPTSPRSTCGDASKSPFATRCSTTGIGMSFRRALLAPAHHAADDRSLSQSRTNSNVSARESVYVVAEVIPSEGADVAGIKVDDVIVSVQGVAASPLSTLQMMDLISGAENSSVQVQVEGTWVAEAPHDAATVQLDNKTAPDARANGDSLARVTPKRVIWNSQSRAIDGSSSGDCGQGGSAPGQRQEVPSSASSEARIGQPTDLSPEGAGQPTRPRHSVDGSAGVGKIDTGNTYIVRRMAAARTPGGCHLLDSQGSDASNREDSVTGAMDAGWSGEADGADMLEASVLGAGEGEGKDEDTMLAYEETRAIAYGYELCLQVA